MRARSLLVPAVALLALTGCGESEAPVLDDGSQGVPLAGLGPQVEAAGVEVVSASAPASASGADVAAALEGADVTAAREVDDATLAVDPAATAGLVSVVVPDDGDAVVLVFGDPAAAAVFAAGDPEVLPDAAGDPDAYLAGNLVAYADGDPDRVRDVLAELAGSPTDSPTESPTGSPTESPTDSPADTPSDSPT